MGLPTGLGPVYRRLLRPARGQEGVREGGRRLISPGASSRASSGLGPGGFPPRPGPCAMPPLEPRRGQEGGREGGVTDAQNAKE